MLAIDTNVLVRYLIEDHPDQAARARRVIETQAVFVSLTVLLETEWVLRHSFNYTPAEWRHAMLTIAGYATVAFEAPDTVQMALDWAVEGMDFADALHLAGAEGIEGFLTFDRKLIRKAAALGRDDVREP